MNRHTPLPTVTILLGTHNGAAHLSAQLASIARQNHRDWRLWVTDDASTDATPEIIDAFARAVPQEVRRLSGPGRGVAGNFLGTLCHPELPEGPVAFCDQDDIWYPHRLGRALDRLQAADAVPALYCSRTDVGIDPDRPWGTSPLWQRPPCFRNALIQTVAGGNTMVLSTEGAALARAAGCDPLPAFHDWWFYQLVSGAGGRILYDSQPTLFYRQHHKNQLGRNRGLQARYARLGTIWQGKYHHWITRNQRALQRCEHLLTEENRAILAEFVALRRRKGLGVVSGWQRLGLHRQGRLETALMTGAAALGRI
ncbi:glycosyltransferase [Salipiger mucosus]|uniref:Glycosyl transferase, group 2 family protein n=1 Tax=Salipiger mucosus DSM 16094 TaxID=1123237 RepID=S9S846_9RHOB|nr:glycosyltransferase [Salipiger mucosus]EPX82419.1 glycosyl transferase, group 2 family protein [Salipiger mucosus DSM 16094]